MTNPDLKQWKEMECSYCGNQAIWCENKEIYGLNYGRSYMVWLCKPCDAYVGCHNNTRQPLGTMANAETREWRKKVHAELDPFWKQAKDRKAARRKIYAELSRHFGREYHTGESDIETCRQVLDYLLTKKQDDQN